MNQSRMLIGVALCCLSLAAIAHAETIQTVVDRTIAGMDTVGTDSETIRDGLEELAGILVLIDPDHAVAPLIRDALSKIRDKDRSVRVASALAIDLVRQGQYDGAAKAYFDIILRFPRDPSITRFQIALARAYIMQQEFDKARATLEPLTRKQSVESSWAVLELARIALLNRHQDEAIRRYRSIPVASPGSFAAKLAERELLHIQLRDQIRKTGDPS